MLSQSLHIPIGQRHSLKDDKLNEILEKMNKGMIISKSESAFLKEFDQILENDLKDSSHISKNQVFERLCKLLDNKKTVICNLYDKDGIIDDEIISIHNFFDENYCLLSLKHGTKTKILDNFLYKITYDTKKDLFYLESTGEYYEKITHSDEN